MTAENDRRLAIGRKVRLGAHAFRRSGEPSKADLQRELREAVERTAILQDSSD